MSTVWPNNDGTPTDFELFSAKIVFRRGGGLDEWAKFPEYTFPLEMRSNHFLEPLSTSIKFTVNKLLININYAQGSTNQNCSVQNKKIEILGPDQKILKISDQKILKISDQKILKSRTRKFWKSRTRKFWKSRTNSYRSVTGTDRPWIPSYICLNITSSFALNLHAFNLQARFRFRFVDLWSIGCLSEIFLSSLDSSFWHAYLKRLSIYDSEKSLRDNFWNVRFSSWLWLHFANCVWATNTTTTTGKHWWTSWSNKVRS